MRQNKTEIQTLFAPPHPAAPPVHFDATCLTGNDPTALACPIDRTAVSPYPGSGLLGVGDTTCSDEDRGRGYTQANKIRHRTILSDRQNSKPQEEKPIQFTRHISGTAVSHNTGVYLYRGGGTT